jgi:FkbM family methyltransferase
MQMHKMSFLREKLRNQAMKLYKRIENNDNPDFMKNGERQLLREVARLLDGSREAVVFDCGANIGTWTKACIQEMSALNYSIHLFEPSASCCKILEQALGDVARIRINRMAVSDVNGKARLFAETDASSLASLYERQISKEIVMKPVETVDVVRLETYIKKEEIAHIHFLKLDIEGNELKAMSGMGKYLNADFVSAIQFEYGGANLDSRSTLRDMFGILTAGHFELFKIMPHYLEPRDFVPSMENFQYSNYVALGRM